MPVGVGGGKGGRSYVRTALVVSNNYYACL